MTGGVSHMDTFDPKPKLIAKQRGCLSAKKSSGAKYLAPLWDFKPGGKCGTEVSDLFPACPRMHGRYLSDSLDARRS